MVEHRRPIKLLPGVNQTDTLTKFFSATVDHLFQPESVEFINGYIGTKPSYYDPMTDFYVGEPTKSRADYQLPETSVSTNLNSGAVTNIMFYHDFVNALQFQGANIDNQSRLFEQEYYSWSPPIDIDKLINYTKYYWIPAGPDPVILLANTDLNRTAIGQRQYTYPGPYQLSSTGEIINEPLVFTTGLVIQTTNDSDLALNGNPFLINGVGRDIELIATPEYLDPNWDERAWDTLGWDGDDQLYIKDYLTIGRSKHPTNQWSSNNRWFHIDVLVKSKTSVFASFQQRAARPIIEFESDMQLYNNGYIGRPNVTYVLSDVSDVFTSIVGQTSYTVFPGIYLQDGDTILVTGDTNSLVNNRVYQVEGLTTVGVITLTLIGGPPVYGETILCLFDTIPLSATGSYIGHVQYWYDGTAWKRSQQRVPFKAPKFMLYDYDGNALDDPSIYPSSTFAGNTVFTYKQDVYAAVDTELGFSPKTDQFGNYVFDNAIVSQTYQYVSDAADTPIYGYAYYRNNKPQGFEFNNEWYRSPEPSRQYIVNDYTVNATTDSFVIDQIPAANPGLLPSIYVTLIYDQQSVLLKQGVDYTVSDNIVKLAVPAVYGQRVNIRSWSNSSPIHRNGYYEVPPNLRANPNNLQISSVTQSQFLQQFETILINQPGFEGEPHNNNNWRDTPQIRGLGLAILQNRAPLIKPMILSSSNVTVGINSVQSKTDPMLAMQFAQRDYNRFYNRFINALLNLWRNGYTAAESPETWVNTAYKQINLGKNPASPWANSGPDGPKGGYTYLKSTNPTYVPPTATRLGVTPAYQPVVYLQGVHLAIQCHNGARIIMAYDGMPLGTIMYGQQSTSNPAQLTNPVAAAWLQFELDLFNNMPDAYMDPQAQLAFDITPYTPGRWRNSDFTLKEFLSINYPMFDKWVINNQVDYRANTTYDPNDQFTWNYSNCPDRNGRYGPGYWQGIYRWYYDTDRPHLAPWEMLGFSQQPSWWTDEYGPAPYTRGNTAMWEDLAAGLIRQGPRAGIYLAGVRPGLLNCIPVDEQGNLLPPLAAGTVASLPSTEQAKSDWQFGDGAPVESVWYYSNEYNFVVAEYSYLMKPAQFIEYNWDTLRNVNVFSEQETDQWIYIDTNNRRPNSQLYVHRENPSAVGGNIQVPNESTLTYYGSGGIQHWISEYVISQNLNITQYLGNIVRGTNVQLAHQVGGFIGSNSYLAVDSFGQIGYSTQLIPTENVKTYLYRSASIRTSFYSGVIITQVQNGWKVLGYDGVNQYFLIIPSNKFGAKSTLVVGNDRVTWYQTPVKAAEEVQYGTIFATKQEVFDFLISLQRYQEFQGWIFDQYDQDGNTTLDWVQAGREFLFWSQGNWANGNFITLSPLAITAKYQQAFGNVQFVNGIISGTYPVIDKAGGRIDGPNLEVLRYDNTITINAIGPQNIYGMRLFSSTLESVILIDNQTAFGDTIYDPLYNIAQPRLKLYAYRTNDWNGRVDAPGYFLYQNGTDNQWNTVPNFEKTADDFRKYYNIEQPKNYTSIDPVTGNLVVSGTSLAAVDVTAISNLAKHQIGFQQRLYLQNLLLEDSTEFQFYQGFIRQKGTRGAISKLLRNNSIIPVTSDFSYYEEYALRASRFGSTALNIGIDFIIPQNQYINDPQQITVFGKQTSDKDLDGVIVLIPNDPKIVVPPTSYSSETNPLFPIRSSLDQDYQVDLPTSGYVLQGETTYTVSNLSMLTSLWSTQALTSNPMKNGDTVWQYIDDKQGWTVWQFNQAPVNVINTAPANSGIPTIINCSGNVDVGTGDIVVLTGISNVTALEGTFVVSNVTGNGNSFTVPVSSYSLGSGGQFYSYKRIRYSTETDRDQYPPLGGWQPGDVAYVDHTTYGRGGWTVYSYINGDWMPQRTQQPKVDAALMLQGKLYNKISGSIYAYLEYYDPAKGFIPSLAQKNLDRRSIYDPAAYNTGDPLLYPIDSARAWGPEHIGETWWDLSSIRYLDYEIGDTAYRWQNWGKIAQGTTVDVYEWVQSPVPPDQWATYVANQVSFVQYGINYTPSGTVLNSSNPAYTTLTTYTAAYTAQTLYYFWVKNATTLPLPPTRNVTTLEIANIITYPTSYGVRWYAAIDDRNILVANVGYALSGEETVLSLLYTHLENNQNDYKQWDLVRENDPTSIPSDYFWLKLKDSLTSKDGQDQNVPDPYLSDIMRYGTLIRPRQSWFKYRLLAAQSYVDKSNQLLLTILLSPDINRSDWKKYFDRAQPAPAADYTVGTISSRDSLAGNIPSGSTVLVLGGADNNNLWNLYSYDYNNGNYLWTRLAVQAFNTPNYWYYVDWYLIGSGVTAATIPTYTVSNLLDREQYSNQANVTVKVLNRGDGYWAIYKWILTNNVGAWVTVGYQNGTIQISDGVYNGSINTMLFGTTPFDSTGFDIFPHVEFGNIIDGLRYAIFNNPNPDVPGESVYLNELFFNMINYILVEQGFVDWIFKTSFITLEGFNIPLSHSEIYKPDYSDALLAYVNEIKPYHVKVREFITQRTLADFDEVYVTDFDNVNVNIHGNTVNAWQQNYLTNPELIRTLKMKLVFDRVASISIGWESYPWAAKAWEFENNTYLPVSFGAFDRIVEFYSPTANMIRKDDPNLITNSDYRGIIMDSLGFDYSPGWQKAPWGAPTGWDADQSAFTNYLDVLVQGGVVPDYDSFYGTGSKRAFNLRRLVQDPGMVVVWANSQLQYYGVDWIIPNYVTSLLLASGGAGYAIGDKLVLDLVPRLAATDITVAAVDEYGAITAWTLDTSGEYDLFKGDVIPVSYQPYAMGSGYGAAFQPVWGGQTLVFNVPPDSNSSPNIFMLYVGTTFLPAPTGPIDIINDGNQFLQPYVGENHPEELYTARLLESTRMDVYSQPSGGSPIIYTRVYDLDGKADHFAMGIKPMDTAAVLVQMDGVLLDYGITADYVINWATNQIVFPVPPTGKTLQILTISAGGTGLGIKQVSVVTGGYGYLPGDSIVLAGGLTANGDAAQVIVNEVIAVQTNILDGGRGYEIGDVLILEDDYATSETYKVELAVTNIEIGTGAITGLSITQGGIYQYVPLSYSYTTNGAGAGSVIDIQWGIFAAIMGNQGTYSLHPTSPIAQNSTTGNGTDATFAALYTNMLSQDIFTGDGSQTQFAIGSPLPNDDINFAMITLDGVMLQNGINAAITATGKIITIDPAPPNDSTLVISAFSNTNFSIVRDQIIPAETGQYFYALYPPPSSTKPQYYSTTLLINGLEYAGPSVQEYRSDGIQTVFAAIYMPENPAALLVYVGSNLQTYGNDYTIVGPNVVFYAAPIVNAPVSLVVVDTAYGWSFQVQGGLLVFNNSPPGWDEIGWSGYFGWETNPYQPTTGDIIKVITYNEDLSYDFNAQRLIGPCYPVVPGNKPGTYVLSFKPYDDSTLMVWQQVYIPGQQITQGDQLTLMYDYQLITVDAIPGWDIVPWEAYGWQTEYRGDAALVFAPGIAHTLNDVIDVQYMSNLPEKPAIAWRTISTDIEKTSTVLSDANRTRLLSDVTVYSDAIEVADITVLGMPTEYQSGTIWIGDERIDYWSVKAEPTELYPNRGFLEQLQRGTFNTPVANVSVLYDSIFYDGDGVTTLFAAGQGSLPIGGNIVVTVGTTVQVDTEIDATVGTYTIVENPSQSMPGTYVSFTAAPAVGWRNVRLATPRAEVKFGSSISHVVGEPVLDASVNLAIPGGYRWAAEANGLQYSKSSMAKFLQDHPGTRS